jgi:flagellar basal-body rod protein FlgG
MLRALYSAATGMHAQQLNIDTISNNLANVNTTGFKKSRADFQDIFYQTIKPAGASATASTDFPTGIQIGNGSKAAAVQKIFTQGDYASTGNQLDVAIDGDGFFQVSMADGTTTYTRAGSFKTDSQGRIVTSNGDPLTPTITIPSDTTDIVIGDDGTVSVRQGGSTDATQIGNIQLAKFINPAGLSAIGRNLFRETTSSGTAQTGTPGDSGFGIVSQGFLELSNVSLVEELIGLIIGQRAYEINSKAVQSADEMLNVAINLVR